MSDVAPGMGKRLACPVCGDLVRGGRFVTCGAPPCVRSWDAALARVRRSEVAGKKAGALRRSARRKQQKAALRAAMTAADGQVTLRVKALLLEADRLAQERRRLDEL